MKYLFAVLVAVLLFNLDIYLLRNEYNVWWFILIPIISLLAGVFLYFFSKNEKTAFSFGLFWGSAVVTILMGLIILFFVSFPPFQ